MVLGLAGLTVALEQGDELVEQIRGIVGAGGRLGVVLHTERRDVEGAESLDDVVVQADVADLDPAVAVRAVDDGVQRRVHGEAVVLRRDLDPAGGLVEDGLVDTAVAERQLVGAEAEGTAEDLVANRDGLPGLAFVVAIRRGPTLTVPEAAQRAGISEERLLQVIRAAGFADPGPDGRTISLDQPWSFGNAAPRVSGEWTSYPRC